MVRGVSRWWWSNRRWPRSSKVMVMETRWIGMLFKEFLHCFVVLCSSGGHGHFRSEEMDYRSWKMRGSKY